MIRILLAEDQSLLRGALATLLSLESDMEVIGQANDGLEALDQVRELKPDILVSDIEMPGLSGIDLASKVKAEKLETRVLIVTTFSRPGYLKRALEAGVNGYVLKDTPSEELADAVRQVAAGRMAIDAELSRAAWSTPDPLSEREREVLRRAELGEMNKQIAAALNLSPGTVRNYLAEAMQKLGASNRVEACRIARQSGWL
ncbi:MAG: response regulator transcription factor [Alphaproteobacteria bacterium]|nr:response regulator transcription factor [Alphaproteobacteria bacterium]